MATSRPLMIPWLIEQIDSRKYPGLHWVNRERTEFCVPWKHALRQDSSGNDVLIFKAWAEISGAYVEGQRPDPSVWKRNFRSALRAKGFQTITDSRNDEVNPHKVFRFPVCQQEASAGRAGKRVRREMERDPGSGAAGSAESQEPVVHPDLSPQFHVCEELYLPEETALPNPRGVDPYYGPGDDLNEILKELNISGIQQEVVQRTVQLGQEGYPTEGAVGVDSEQQRLMEFTNEMSRTKVEESLVTEFNVSVYYRGAKVLEELVKNSAGFKVVFSPEQIQYDQHLATVILPSPDQIPIRDQMQAQLTRRILEKLGEGLQVTTQGPAVYALRRGDSRIYWGLCKHERGGVPREVSKQGDQLYTLKEFIAGLLEFMTNKGPSPSFSLFFCLGEKWPDPSQRPWEKKLITVEVSLVSLELLKAFAVDGGASSLQSADLQLSNSRSFLSSLQEMMDTL